MKRLLLLLIVVGGLILGTDMDLKAQSAAKEEMRVAKAPLFRDPIHDGAADTFSLSVLMKVILCRSL